MNRAKYELVTNVGFNDDKSAKALMKHSQSTPPSTPKALPNHNKHFQIWPIKQKLMACKDFRQGIKLRTLDEKFRFQIKND